MLIISCRCYNRCHHHLHDHRHRHTNIKSYIPVHKVTSRSERPGAVDPLFGDDPASPSSSAEEWSVSLNHTPSFEATWGQELGWALKDRVIRRDEESQYIQWWRVYGSGWRKTCSDLYNVRLTEYLIPTQTLIGSEDPKLIGAQPSHDLAGLWI